MPKAISRRSAEGGEGVPALTADEAIAEPQLTRTGSPSSWQRRKQETASRGLLRGVIRIVAMLAVLSSVILLVVGAMPLLTGLPGTLATRASRLWELIKTWPLGALPLMLAGAAYLMLQAILRPRPLGLLKRVALGGAFILWGIVLIMPPGNRANELGNLVIALYVVDLALMIHSDL